MQKKKNTITYISDHYYRIGQKAREKPVIYETDGIMVVCVRYDDVWLEFSYGKYIYMFRDRDGNIDYDTCSDLEYIKAVAVILGFLGK